MGNNKKANFVFIIDLPVQPVKKMYTLISDSIKLLERKRAYSSGKIHWAFSSTLFADLSQKAGASIRDLLKKRIISHHDSIIPKGFSGSSHSLLMYDELEKEINWGLSNTWSTGVKDLFDIYPDAWIPADMDLLRNELRLFYDSYPYIWIVLPPSKKKETVAQCVYKTDLLEFPILFLNGMDENDIAKKLKKWTGRWQTPLFIHFSLESPESLFSLENFFAAVERLYGAKWSISFDCLDTHLLQRQERHVPAGNEKIRKEILTHTPAHRLARMKGYRNHIPVSEAASDEKIASFLHDFGKACSTEYPEVPKKSDTPFSVKERSLFANMPGLAFISEKNQAVQFNNGRLTDISYQNKSILCGLPVQSYIALGDGSLVFQPTTSFSFEDEGIRGLRESLIVEKRGKELTIMEEGYLVVDYYFRENVRDLVISVHIRYPEFSEGNSISTFAPLEIPLYLFDRSESVTLQGLYPNGESYFLEFGAEETVGECTGSMFCIQAGTRYLAVNLAVTPNTPVGILPVRVTKRKKHYLLSINPMGSYRQCSAALLGGVGEYFTFLLKGWEGVQPQFSDFAVPQEEHFDSPWIRKQNPPKG